jgi:AraC-like DNA-binding protein
VVSVSLTLLYDDLKNMSIYVNTVVTILMIFVLTIFSLLLLHIGRHTKSNVYLAVYFISQIVGILTYLFTPSSHILFLLGKSIYYAWGALFYLFISALLNPGFHFKGKTVLHFIPAALVFILLVNQSNNIFLKFNAHQFLWLSKNMNSALNVFFNILIIGYNIAIIYKYYLYSVKAKSTTAFGKINTTSIWIKFSVFGFFISCFVVQLGNTHFFQSINWFIVGMGTFLIYFTILLYIAIINRTITDKIGIVEKYKKSSLNINMSNEIIDQIEIQMQEKKMYLNPELSLKNLSVALNIQEKYISEAINKLKGQNFSEFVNNYRVSYSMQLLKNPENKDKTMLYILFESGFNSKTTFNNSFKKIVGCTPLEFKRNQ